MTTSEIFDNLLENLKVGDASATIAARRDEITKALNKHFRAQEGSTDYKLMVGSYGRHTAIRGVSDLDMIYILPPDLRANYNSDTGPRRMLNRVRDILKARYPNTDIRVDQCVVRVQFSSNKFKFEVQPAFENDDDSFDYPDTLAERWKTTKPRDEISETRDCNARTSNNMRRLARMARAWKNTNGVNMGGLLIDTLVHRFFANTNDYDTAGTALYDLMARDFFRFLADEPDKSYYLALGSKQQVKVKARFQPKAKKAYNRCIDAIANESTTTANKKWREVFGASVPLKVAESKWSFKDTEEFIEAKFPIDVTETLTVDCHVTQNGWRPASLRDMLRRNSPLLPNKVLDFTITECSVPKPFQVTWKVLNRGDEAERRDNIRGQLVSPNLPHEGRREYTEFRGEHLVECFIVKDDIVVASDRIEVPISGDSGP
ncbi:nucleotidyltransferase [Nocardia nova]|nr:nucleotidyltransferase [Nocardia nova]PPJ02685.1 nucleotidyltransferase [Nocardia nova]